MYKPSPTPSDSTPKTTSILKPVLITLALVSVLTNIYLLNPTILSHPRVSLTNLFPSPATTSCLSPATRKEWSTATTSEKKEYINSVLCLETKPSRIGLNTTLSDDFSWVHNALILKLHGFPQFLPWHRYFLHIYEGALKECGYTGSLMYWDWALPTRTPSTHPVFSLTTGFGGNGIQTTPHTPFSKCILGPIASLRPSYYNYDYHPHCITRDFEIPHPENGLIEMTGDQYTQEIVDKIMAEKAYVSFRQKLEGRVHAAVHQGVGQETGDMASSTSPNDPLFYLHHTMLDRIWWLWQQTDPENRVYDYGGRKYGNLMAGLEDIIIMMGIAPDRKIADFMSTETEDLCYVY